MLWELFIAACIVAICVLMHVTGLVLLAKWLKRHSERLQRPTYVRSIFVLLLVFAWITILHFTETAVWAAFYQAWEIFPDFETSFYFSLTSYTTMGFGDVVLPQKWRLLGGLEGICGVLLCGLSTAFLYVMLTKLNQWHEEFRKANVSQ